MMTQTNEVISALRALGGIATFGKLNAALDFSAWATKTPEASVRRIVQQNSAFYKVRPGLWALTECRDRIAEQTGEDGTGGAENPEYTHTYFQGLAVEIGNLKGMQTWVPNQDKNRKFINKPLKEVATLGTIPQFGYEKTWKRAANVDVVWFNDRNMPSRFIEVEHTTDIKIH
jgi:hypothetical protein